MWRSRNGRAIKEDGSVSHFERNGVSVHLGWNAADAVEELRQGMKKCEFFL